MSITRPLANQLVTSRFAAVDTTGQDISLPVDVRNVSVHIEGATDSVVIRGGLPAGKAFLDAAAVVDNTGDVLIDATAHGFTIGDSVTIVGTTNYDGTYELLSGGDADTLDITATYVAETIPATAYAIGYRDARITTDGITVTLDHPINAEEVFFTAKAPTGTIDVSVIATSV